MSIGEAIDCYSTKEALISSYSPLENKSALLLTLILCFPSNLLCFASPWTGLLYLKLV